MLKKVMKLMLGQSGWNRLVSRIKYVKTQIYFKHNQNLTFRLNKEWEKEDYYVKGSHTFFGYYDIAQMNVQEDKLLAHVIKHKSITSRDSATVGYFSITDKKFVPVTMTRAWCWQQGARLRWHPLENNSIIVNDVDGDHYIARIVRLDTKETVRVIPMALYDINNCFNFGLSLNFSRLQRLRPGYGYDTLKDVTEMENAPSNDGIFYIDLNNDRIKLLISLKELAKDVDVKLIYQHYINHISIAPDGKRFMFFHIWNVPELSNWKTRLCVYNLATEKIMILEDTDKVSHYDWKSSEELLVTCYKPNKEQYYAIYNVITGEKTYLSSIGLNKDGHPSCYMEGTRFISDTYPLDHNLQKLFEYDINTNIQKDIVEAYSSPLLYGEQRCDMHPRLALSEKYITFDSTYSDNRRKIVLLKRRQNE